MSRRRPGRSSGRAALAAATFAIALSAVSASAAKKGKPKPPGPRHPPAAIGVTTTPKASAEPSSRALQAPPLAVDRVTLDNGLRVVLSPDPRATTVSVAMTYDVGARNEDRGATGLASLLERLMFQGSANVLRGEHARLVESRGGEATGSSSPDRTQFVDVAPPSELPLLLWLEADRLKSLQVRDETVESQLAALAAEARIDQATPLSTARARVRELVFQAFFPYEHDPRGVADLPQQKTDNARAFYEAFFATNTAVLSIAGDFEADHAVSLVHRFFDTAKKQDKTPPFVPPQQPEQTSQRTAVLEDARQKTAAFLLGWAVPPTRTEDHYALEAALDALVSDGGRLPQKLLLEKGWARSVCGRLDGLAGPDLLTLEVSLLDDASREIAEASVLAEVDALAKTGPTDAELARFRQHRERAAWEDLTSTKRRSELLGELELTQGDSRLLGSELSRAAAVTRDRVKAAVARYLSPARRTLVEVLPPRDPADVAKKPAHAAMPSPVAPPKKTPSPATKGRPRG